LIPPRPSGRLADLFCWSLWPEFLSEKLKIRHSVYGHLTPRGITPRRLAAAKSALRREREGLAYFADFVRRELKRRGLPVSDDA